MGRIIVKDKIQEFVRQNVIIMDMALGTMGGDLANISKIRQPFKSGDMMKETYHEKIAVLKHVVIVNTPYAAVQERGSRDDGSYAIRKYSTPGTGKEFLIGAAEVVFKNGVNYFRQAVNNNQLNLGL